MRKLTAFLAMMATIAGALPPAPAFAQQANQTFGPPDVNQTDSACAPIYNYPNGGEPLKLAIYSMVVNNPTLASGVASCLQSHPELTAEQKDATIAGLNDALKKLGIVADTSTGLTSMEIALIAGGALGAAGLIALLATHNGNSKPVSP